MIVYQLLTIFTSSYSAKTTTNWSFFFSSSDKLKFIYLVTSSSFLLKIILFLSPWNSIVTWEPF